MRISVLGLGYVGSVSAACLAHDGHDVIGVDPNPTKVGIIMEGRSPVIELGLDELIAEAIESGRLSATADAPSAIAQSDAALICVGTPSNTNGSLDLSHVEAVSKEIGEALANREAPFTVILRSTVLPGTTVGTVIPALESASGKRAGDDFAVCFNPEFLREGSSVEDYYSPPKIIVGTVDEKPNPVIDELYKHLQAPRIATSYDAAELVKYVDNSWHALKVAFANEVGRIGRSLDIDSREVMDIFIQDTKLNISPRYLRPGFAFGGSCLPKDLQALQYRARQLDVDVPVLRSIMWSNDRHIELAFEIIAATGSKRVGILGLSFKAGTDDLRHSPMVEVVERLIGKGYDVRIHDPNVEFAALVGANREHILNQIPHISQLMVSGAAEAVGFGSTIVIGTSERSFVDALAMVRSDQHVIDLVGLESPPPNGTYHGIAW